jgi:exonuclease III
MRFGAWNVRSLYRAGSLKTVSRELARYKIDLVGVQKVRWEAVAFSMERDMRIMN